MLFSVLKLCNRIDHFLCEIEFHYLLSIFNLAFKLFIAEFAATDVAQDLNRLLRLQSGKCPTLCRCYV